MGTATLPVSLLLVKVLTDKGSRAADHIEYASSAAKLKHKHSQIAIDCFHCCTPQHITPLSGKCTSACRNSFPCSKGHPCRNNNYNICLGQKKQTSLQDPLADGPTIQAAHSKGLETGTTSDKVARPSKFFPSKSDPKAKRLQCSAQKEPR